MPAIGSNGFLAPGTYVVRFNSPRYSRLRSDCWYAWARANGVTLLTRHWQPPERSGFELYDQKRLELAFGAERLAGGLEPNRFGLDGDEYQGFRVDRPTPFWDYRGECGFAAWPWNGSENLERAATGAIAQPYHELNAAVDTARNITTDVGRAIDSPGRVIPWYVTAGVGVVLLGVLRFAIRGTR